MEIIKKALDEVARASRPPVRGHEEHRRLGASLALCDYPFDLVAEVIRSQFKGSDPRSAR